MPETPKNSVDPIKDLEWLANFVQIDGGRGYSRLASYAATYLRQQGITVNTGVLADCMDHYGLREVPTRPQSPAEERAYLAHWHTLEVLMFERYFTLQNIPPHKQPSLSFQRLDQAGLLPRSY